MIERITGRYSSKSSHTTHAFLQLENNDIVVWDEKENELYRSNFNEVKFLLELVQFHANSISRIAQALKPMKMT